MNAAPAVTVLTCVHDGAAHLREALDGVLAQTFEDFEFVIVDDASTEPEAREILRETAGRDRRVRLVVNPENVGLTRSLNRGLAHARGALVARQDADDVSAPERLARQAAFLRERPDVVLLGTRCAKIDAEGRPAGAARPPLGDLEIRWRLLFDNAFVHSSVTMRRDALTAAGGYDEAFRVAQDYALWRRMLAHGEGANLPEALVRLRVHEASVSRRDAPAQEAAALATARRAQTEMLGRDPGEERARALRETRGRRVRLRGAEDFRTAEAVLDLFEAFERSRPAAQRGAVRGMRAEFVRATLLSAPGAALPRALASRFGRRALGAAPGAVLGQPFARLARRFGGAAGGKEGAS